MRGRHIVPLSLLAGAVVLSGGCTADEVRPGELILAVQTDMSLPKDVDQVRIDVISFGNIVFKNTYPVGAGGLRIPATLGILPGSNARSLVTIRVIAFQNDKPRMLREVVTTVPATKLGLLRIPVQWLSDGSAVRPNPDNAEDIRSTCPDGQTNIAGSCAPWEIDSSTLPDFTPETVFGGGTADGAGGACFETTRCLDNAVRAQVDAASCTFALPAELGRDVSKINVGLSLPPGSDGICDATRCLIPLDMVDGSGWVLDTSSPSSSPNVKLPRAVCEKVAAEQVSVVVSTTCDTKIPRTPSCGPWSSVGTGGTADGGTVAREGGEGPPDVSGGDSGQLGGVQLIQNVTNPAAIALAADNTIVFVSRDGVLGRKLRDGTGPTPTTPPQTVGGAIFNLATNERGEADPATSFGSDHNGGRVFHFSAATLSPQLLVANVPNVAGVGAAAGMTVFGYDSGIGGCNSGGCVEASSIFSGPPVANVFADPSGVVFFVSGSSVFSCPLVGGCGVTQTLVGSNAKAAPGEGRIIADTNNVYWVNEATGEINVVARSGGVSRVLDSGPPGTVAPGIYHGLAVQNGKLYYTRGDEVRVVDVASGTKNVIATLQSGAAAVAVDSQFVYWAAFSGNAVFRKLIP